MVGVGPVAVENVGHQRHVLAVWVRGVAEMIWPAS